MTCGCCVQDLIAAGIIDPAKVTRSGLTNACGIAGIMLTTQVCSACCLMVCCRWCHRQKAFCGSFSEHDARQSVQSGKCKTCTQFDRGRDAVAELLYQLTMPSPFPHATGQCRCTLIADLGFGNEQAVMVDKPKDKLTGKASAMDTMGYSPSGMPAGLTL